MGMVTTGEGLDTLAFHTQKASSVRVCQTLGGQEFEAAESALIRPLTDRGIGHNSLARRSQGTGNYTTIPWGFASPDTLQQQQPIVPLRSQLLNDGTSGSTTTTTRSRIPVHVFTGDAGLVGGIVIFETPDDARNAIQQFNGYDWQGRMCLDKKSHQMIAPENNLRLELPLEDMEWY
ncbi:hypothetical protein B0T09DRAFT_384613 [Sordaria sp. MPI-SDFR-AT-0083]|nr:hypothetical protein B0T09DRAFT_384613 [Sordaria sp. MPI-SDFR-AT-0083]